MSPLISVVVPIYNAEKFLDVCLESIVKQSYTEFEIILVDDGSTDNTSSIMRFYANKDKRIKIINKKNGGPNSARKIGVKNAKGQYIMFVDGDDFLALNAINRIAHILLLDDSIDIVCTGYTKIIGDKKSDFYETYNTGVYDKERLILEIYPSMMSCEKNIPGKMIRSLWTKIIKKELLLKVINDVDESIMIGEDLAVGYACLCLADKIYVDANNVNYFYRFINNSLSHKYNAKWLENVEHFTEWMHWFASKYNCENILDALCYETFSQFYDFFDYEIAHCIEAHLSVTKRFKEINGGTIANYVYSKIQISKLPLSIWIKTKVWLIKHNIVWPFVFTYRFRNIRNETSYEKSTIN